MAIKPCKAANNSGLQCWAKISDKGTKATVIDPYLTDY